MGYYATLNAVQIDIPAYQFPTICQHLKHCGFIDPRNMNGGRYTADGIVENWFSWCDMAKLKQCLDDNDLLGVLECFRFETSTDSHGRLIDLHFNDSVGDELHLFKAMADVLPGTHRLTWHGESGEMWRWLIRDNELTVIDGITIFPGDIQ